MASSARAARATSRGERLRIDVAQPRVVAAAHDGGEFVGRPRDLPDRLERLVALGTVQLLGHLCQCRSNDVVMVDVRPDRLGGVEPELMNEIEIRVGERRRVGAEEDRRAVRPLR